MLNLNMANPRCTAQGRGRLVEFKFGEEKQEHDTNLISDSEIIKEDTGYGSNR